MDAMRSIFLTLSMILLISQAFASSNQLADTPSAYLRAHAQQPVHWQVWNEKTLARARRENKPIFLSIGYASCHWCHVMAAESFSDPAVAKILNEHFISIKVDRELRPDLDAHFLDMLRQLNQGIAGWPANLFLTPDLQPIYGGVYFPPKPRYGKPSFTQVLHTLAKVWQKDGAQQFRQSASTIENKQVQKGQRNLTQLRERTLKLWQAAFDGVHGGFGDRSKFPRPSLMRFLLDEARFAENTAARTMVEKTLANMAIAGVRDVAGGLFHRYGVQASWSPPHFEIMLYDNAQLARLYLRAAKALQAPAAKRVTQRLLDALLRDMRLPNGCFAASFDAVTKQGEGTFTTWTEQEIDLLLGAQADEFKEQWLDPFQIPVEERLVVAYQPIERLSTVAQLQKRWFTTWEKLRLSRQSRPKAKRYDQLNVTWNGMAITALAEAAQWLDQPAYGEAAKQCLNQLLSYRASSEGLRHIYDGHQTGDVGFAQDHAALLQALLAMYGWDHHAQWLLTAEKVAAELLHAYQVTPQHPIQERPLSVKSPLPPRHPITDDPEPSLNAMVVESLYRLSGYTGTTKWQERAAAIFKALQTHSQVQNGHAPALLSSQWQAPEQRLEVAIIGKRGAKDVQQMRDVAKEKGHVGMVLTFHDPAEHVEADWPVLFKPMLADKATGFVCRALRCLPPTTDPKELAKQMQTDILREKTK
ncbi:thioredoxin domain-containing protein [Magnetococcus sp. PR-3]|uniref:thioredoxin domain-containing protein n=1 Tax=Magnetococcus sp. PR-3 TaxID=3120355 RepID=UPI002FCE2142